MNVAWTRAAEGFPRRAFTVADVQRMLDSGIIAEGERVELIKGELVVMAAKSVAHDNVQNALNLLFAKVVPAGLYVGNSSTLQLTEDILVEPDLAIISRGLYKRSAKGFARPRAEDVLLVVEIAVSSLAYDRDVKAQLYAQHGIPEYWLIDANERTTWVHKGPSAGNWPSIAKHGPEEILTTPALPGLAIKLSAID
jgi:Uma2 family endonuclease